MEVKNWNFDATNCNDWILTVMFMDYKGVKQSLRRIMRIIKYHLKAKSRTKRPTVV